MDVGKKQQATNGKPRSKMDAVRQILAADPSATASVIVVKAKALGVTIDPKMAGTYRYHVLSKQRHKNRKAVRAVQASNPSASDKSDGVDDLLRAARKLGWQRVQEIVSGVLNAPS
jgi:hypothetical protein